MDIILSVTSRCNLNCEECGQKHWRAIINDGSKPYHMTKAQIANLIVALEDSDYDVRNLILSGGEPCLWLYPSEVYKLKDCANIHRIILYTNGSIRIPAAYIKACDEIVISVYSKTSEKVIEQVEKRFKGKIKYKNKHHFWEWPKGPTEGIPKGCCCRPVHVIGNRVQPCGQIAEICARYGVEPGYNDSPLVPNFMDNFIFKHGQEIWCRFCIESISNQRRGYIKKVANSI